MADFQFPALDNAIGVFEGIDIPGSVAQRNNNPGNLVFNDWSRLQGAIGSDGSGFAVFPDLHTGASALDSLVGIRATQGLTLGELVRKWSPPTAPGNSEHANKNYTDFIGNAVGGNSSTPIANAKGVTGALDSARDWLRGIMGLPPIGDQSGATGPLPPGANTSKYTGVTSVVGWLTDPARIVTLIVGIIIIAAGLWSLKPVQSAVSTTVRAGARLAA